MTSLSPLIAITAVQALCRRANPKLIRATIQERRVPIGDSLV